MGNIAGWDGKGWEAYFRGKENDKTKLEKLVYVTVKINVYVTVMSSSIPHSSGSAPNIKQ